MSPVDQSVVTRKVDVITDRLEELTPFGAADLDAYTSDRARKKGAEKFLQELVNTALDLNYHVLTQSGHQLPEGAFDSFLRMSRIGVLDADLAPKLAPFGGLRNRLVHEYEEIDDVKVHAAIREALDLFPKYAAQVKERSAGL